jgi:hypothetical protein
MTADVIATEQYKKKQDISIDEIMAIIGKNRCRHLSREDVMSIYKDIEEEIMYGMSCYELLNDKPDGQHKYTEGV